MNALCLVNVISAYPDSLYPGLFYPNTLV